MITRFDLANLIIDDIIGRGFDAYGQFHYFEKCKARRCQGCAECDQIHFTRSQVGVLRHRHLSKEGGREYIIFYVKEGRALVCSPDGTRPLNYEINLEDPEFFNRLNDILSKEFGKEGEIIID